MLRGCERNSTSRSTTTQIETNFTNLATGVLRRARNFCGDVLFFVPEVRTDAWRRSRGGAPSSRRRGRSVYAPYKEENLSRCRMVVEGGRAWDQGFRVLSVGFGLPISVDQLGRFVKQRPTDIGYAACRRISQQAGIVWRPADRV